LYNLEYNISKSARKVLQHPEKNSPKCFQASGLIEKWVPKFLSRHEKMSTYIICPKLSGNIKIPELPKI
jgi:hypothetical protein